MGERFGKGQPGAVQIRRMRPVPHQWGWAGATGDIKTPDGRLAWAASPHTQTPLRASDGQHFAARAGITDPARGSEEERQLSYRVSTMAVFTGLSCLWLRTLKMRSGFDLQDQNSRCAFPFPSLNGYKALISEKSVFFFFCCQPRLPVRIYRCRHAINGGLKDGKHGNERYAS